MEPLRNYRSYKRAFTFKQLYPPGFGSLTGKPHLGVDLIGKTGGPLPVGTPIIMPFDGKVTQAMGSEAGYYVTAYFQDVALRALHLSRFGASGIVKAGTVIGYTGGVPGSPGSGVTTIAHVHLDLSKRFVDLSNINNFLDPDGYPWDQGEGDSITLADEIRIKIDGWYNSELNREPDLEGHTGHYNYVMSLIDSGMNKVAALRDGHNKFVKAPEWREKNKNILD